MFLLREKLPTNQVFWLMVGNADYYRRSSRIHILASRTRESGNVQHAAHHTIFPPGLASETAT
jgi:hypothetical protein